MIHKEYKIVLLNPFTCKAKSNKLIDEFDRRTERKLAFEGDEEVNSKDIEVINRDVNNLRNNFRVWSKKVKKIFKEYDFNDADFAEKSQVFSLNNCLKLKLKPETLKELISVSAVADNFGWQAIHIKYYIDSKKLEEFVKNNLDRCLAEDLTFE